MSIQLELRDIAFLDISVPHWSEIAEAPANRGIVRHGNVERASGNIPGRCKLTYAEHARPFLAREAPSILVWGTRNSAQNLLLPMYDARRNPRLLCRFDEPWERATYFALVQWDDGHRTIEEVRFCGSWTKCSVEVRQADETWALCPLVWAVTGQPILWDSNIPQIALLAGLTYDLRHTFHLCWEAHQHCETHAKAHREMMDAFMMDLDAPPATRGMKLLELAAEHGIATETGYLHSTVGIGKDGTMILVARHGALTMLGETQRQLGAHRAILLDNGGSVGYALCRSADSPPVYMGNGTYFRPHGHAVFVAGLAADLIEAPFRM